MRHITSAFCGLAIGCARDPQVSSIWPKGESAELSWPDLSGVRGSTTSRGRLELVPARSPTFPAGLYQLAANPPAVMWHELRSLPATIATFFSGLNGWAWYGSVRTIDAAVSWQGFCHSFALGTLPKKLAGISRHCVRLSVPTIGACYD